MQIKINLLPPQIKEEIENSRIVGLMLKIFFMAIFSLVVFLVFLQFCLHFISLQEGASKGKITSFERNESYVQVKESQDFLRDYSKRAISIKGGLKKQKNYWGVIEEVNKVVPQGVALRELKVDEKEAVLIGKAASREDLLFLKTQLEKSEIFTNIESPISNLVANENVDFEFKMKINFQ